MKWQKAGRPSNKEKENKPEWLEQEWTKEELSVISATKHSAYVILAISVVKQWIRDGKPKSEYDGVRPWIKIIQDSLADKNNKLALNKIDLGD